MVGRLGFLFSIVYLENVVMSKYFINRFVEANVGFNIEASSPEEAEELLTQHFPTTTVARSPEEAAELLTAMVNGTDDIALAHYALIVDGVTEITPKKVSQ